ncbi:MAG: pre-peptidase C-terminal domain-containing protein [Colwellia sp.]|nr:pre-peptidase C-terminal domain-containing protein [Colwellia sp.]
MNNISLKNYLITTVLTISSSASVFAGENINTTDISSLKQTVLPHKNFAGMNGLIEYKLTLSPESQGGAKHALQKNSIYRFGAKSIKLHFKHFELPEGAYLEVSNSNGSEVYRYGQLVADRDGYTFDVKAGDDGINQFSAMSISGEQVHLKLVAADGSELTQGYHVEIDALYQDFGTKGITLLNLNNDSKIMNQCSLGTDLREDIACYENKGFDAEVDRSRPTAYLRTFDPVNNPRGWGHCTAWRVGSGNLMMTNNHCISSQEDVNLTEITFNYQNNTCNIDNDTDLDYTGAVDLSTGIKITADRLLKTDRALDYALFSISDSQMQKISQFGFYELDTNIPDKGQRIYIPQHPAGSPKKLAIESRATSSGYCEVVYSEMNQGSNPLDGGAEVGYKCDTYGGSSGSPVLSAQSNKVMAIHFGGGCRTASNFNVNRGKRMSEIWPTIAHFFDSTPNDGKPTAQTSFSIKESDVTFKNNSYDLDGSLVSHFWDFGDGISKYIDINHFYHRYDNPGNYRVTLTVTDNDGNTDSTEMFVTIGDIAVVSEPINNGDKILNINAQKNQWRYYLANIPKGVSEMNVRISGGTGNANLYSLYGQQPRLDEYSCATTGSGNWESCLITDVKAGSYYFGLYAAETFNNLTLRFDYTLGKPSFLNISQITAPAKTWRHYEIQVEKGTRQLVISTTANNGDADLYVRYNNKPNANNFNFSSTSANSNERIILNNPKQGTLYVSVFAWSAFNQLTLKATPSN